jgi:hypothetical protein
MLNPRRTFRVFLEGGRGAVSSRFSARAALGLYNRRGGRRGCVVAGRLSQTMPDVRIALIEAGAAEVGRNLQNYPSYALRFACSQPVIAY